MMLYKGFLVLKMVLRLKLLVELPEMGHALLFFFWEFTSRLWAIACETQIRRSWSPWFDVQ